jgi:retron-type reverse transcriptase
MQNKKKLYPINQSPFFRLRSRRRLARLLYINLPFLEQLAKDTAAYHEWDDLDEDSGKVRHIENPQPRLKKVQGRITKLLGTIEPPDFLFCPAKRRSFVSNAKRHIGSKVVFTIDIKKYFQSSRPQRVFHFFRTCMECSPDVAAVLTKLSTFKGHLPTGSPLSPLMSFYAHWDMWCRIATVVKTENCTLTVYMDDLTVSGQRISGQLIWAIKKIIHGTGLRYHKEKYYAGRFSVITGIIVREEKLSLPNAKHRKAYLIRREYLDTADVNHRNLLGQKLEGTRSLARQIENANKT